MKRSAAFAGVLVGSVALTLAVTTGIGSSTRPSAQQENPRLPGALLILEKDFEVREITPTGKRGPVLFEHEDEVRARPGGDDFLIALDDTAYLVIELARPGEQEVEVTKHPSYGPAWTPDGRGFAYTRVIGSPLDLAAVPNVLVLRRRARDPASERVLTARSRRIQDSEPAWAPDGRRLAFTRQLELVNGTIYVFDLATGRERRITAGEDADWSPTGNALVYVYEFDLYVIDVTTGHRRRLTSGNIDGQPMWSPDGRTIAFERLAGDETQIRLIPANGGRSRVLVGEAYELLDWPRPRSRKG